MSDDKKDIVSNTRFLLKEYSLSASLKKKNKSDEHFENVLKRLSLEEVIALKIEVNLREANTLFLGIPIYKNISHSAKIGVLLAAISASNSLKEAGAVIGLTEFEFVKRMVKYRMSSYFNDEIKKLKNYDRDMAKELHNMRKELKKLKQESQNELDISKDV
jgi:hypothetical protein